MISKKTMFQVIIQKETEMAIFLNFHFFFKIVQKNALGTTLYHPNFVIFYSVIINLWLSYDAQNNWRQVPLVTQPEYQKEVIGDLSILMGGALGVRIFSDKCRVIVVCSFPDM